MKKLLAGCITAMALALSFAPAHAGTYGQTKYPIVLVHGVLGFDNIGPVEYFYGIPSALRADGAQVFLVQVSAANSHEVRGEQLLTQVKKILAATGAAKVNLVAHSQGSPTSRYVASVSPALVASVSSVGGVNKGTPVADVVVGLTPPGSLSSAVLSSVGSGITTVINFLSGGTGLSQNTMAAANAMTTPGMIKFNQKFPAGVPTTACGEGAYKVNNVAYYSWSGSAPYTNVLDVLDPAIKLLSLAFGGAKSDGLVGTCASHLGQVIRDDYGMNHMDEVNQTIGLVNLFETNPVTIYRQHANRLKNAGL